MLDRFVGAAAHAFSELRENHRDSMWWRHRIGNRIIGPFHLHVHPGRTGSTYVTDEDWDNLLVLDGCRADLFEETVDTTQFDEYRRVLSPGSKTPEWAEQNFGGGEYGDIVYVASNGQVTGALDGRVHELIEVWRVTDAIPRPEDTTRAARRAHERYPDKRLVVHYLQPHRPFLTSDIGFSEGFRDNPWKALGQGKIEREAIWSAYRENLEVVVDDALDLLEWLPGRNVLTSDHGNLLGESPRYLPIRLYGHPGGVRVPELVEVPWVLKESDERPTIRPGAVGERTGEASAASVREHLRDLGYVD